MNVMQVNRLIRTAVRIVKGVELRQTGSSFEIIVLSGILWFKVVPVIQSGIHDVQRQSCVEFGICQQLLA